MRKVVYIESIFFLQAEDGIRSAQESRGLGDVYKRQTVICDSMAAFLMSREKIDAVITGADRIALNGDTANKIGTYGLAVAADRHNVPFYIAAPLSTIDFNLSLIHI